MNITKNYYRRNSPDEVIEQKPPPTRGRKKAQPIVNEPEEGSNPQYPDSVLITVKREIASIQDNLELITRLKEAEKPLTKRLKVLEKCLQELYTLEHNNVNTLALNNSNAAEALNTIEHEGVQSIHDFE